MKNRNLTPIAWVLVVLFGAAFAFNRWEEQGSMVEFVRIQLEKDQLQVDIDNITNDAMSFRNSVEEYQNYLESDPKFFLYLVDRDLDSLAIGGKVRGSFSHYFLPKLTYAISVGATKNDIDVRVDKLILLAESGHPLSNMVTDLMTKGGPPAIRTYVEEWIWGVQSTQ